MPLDNLARFQLKRVNPFQGLVIDADAWRDAHNYHRDHHRLHLLAFHQVGVVEGLDVIANNPADLSVTVQPGIGVDPDGNVIIVHQQQRYRLQTQKKGIVYLVVQFREVPGEPFQPPNGGQPTRVLDAYKIEERDKLPSDPYLELARIDFDPSRSAIVGSKPSQNPGTNEIDSRFRRIVKAEVVESRPPVAAASPQPQTAAKPLDALLVGHAVLGEGDAKLHLSGLQNLARQLSYSTNLAATVQGNINLEDDLGRYGLLYLAGTGRFELDQSKQAALARFLQVGGAIVGEGCSEGSEDGPSRGAKDFGLAFNQLAGQLKRRPEIVKRGHPLLSALHLFPDIPVGAETAMLLEGGRMIYCGSDYGCAWQGGHQRKPLARDVVRSAFEFGGNILAYAREGRASGR